jgi:peptide/nickel transport system substrate-binding protein/oligopeptide transport system substrate-binding protein
MNRPKRAAPAVLMLALGGAFLLASPLVAAESPSEFVVAFNDFAPELDPHHSIYSAEAQIFTATYEGLFSYDPSSLEPVRAACRSFVRSRDGLTWTFNIREEAIWSDGTPLLARDFRDAWLRAISPAEGADYASFFDVIAGARDFRLGKNRDPASVGVSVVADKVLQVKLAAPAAYFSRLLCHHSFSPVHPSLLADPSRFGRLPFPVNGPYTPRSLKDGELILEKNERYWDADSVQLPRIRAIFTDDEAGVTARFDAGEIHWLAGPMDLEKLVDEASLQASPMFGTQYWFWDAGDPVWKKAELRRALALLLPWEEIRSREEYLIPADTLVLPYEGYDAATGIEAADEAAARELLAAAGHPDGTGLPPLVIILPEGGDDSLRVARIMKEAWERLPGFSVTLKTVPAGAYFDIVRTGPEAGGYDLALTTWIGDFADPLAFLQMWSSDSNLNDGGYADPEFDRLLAAAAPLEGQDRLTALAKAETRLLSGAACLPLYHSIAVNVVDSGWIEGWYANALDLHPFKYLGFGQRKIRPNVVRAFGPGLRLAAAGAPIPLGQGVD